MSEEVWGCAFQAKKLGRQLAGSWVEVRVIESHIRQHDCLKPFRVTANLLVQQEAVSSLHHRPPAALLLLLLSVQLKSSVLLCHFSKSCQTQRKGKNKFNKGESFIQTGNSPEALSSFISWLHLPWTLTGRPHGMWWILPLNCTPLACYTDTFLVSCGKICLTRWHQTVSTRISATSNSAVKHSRSEGNQTSNEQNKLGELLLKNSELLWDTSTVCSHWEPTEQNRRDAGSSAAARWRNIWEQAAHQWFNSTTPWTHKKHTHTSQRHRKSKINLLRHRKTHCALNTLTVESLKIQWRRKHSVCMCVCVCVCVYVCLS